MINKDKVKYELMGELGKGVEMPENINSDDFTSSVLYLVAYIYIETVDTTVSLWILKQFLRENRFISYTSILQEEYDQFAKEMPINDILESISE